jgi:hypothetical protein
MPGLLYDHRQQAEGNLDPEVEIARHAWPGQIRRWRLRNPVQGVDQVGAFKRLAAGVGFEPTNELPR